MAAGFLLCLLSVLIAKTDQTEFYTKKLYSCKALYEFKSAVTAAVFTNSTYGINEKFSQTTLPAVVTIPANSSVRLTIGMSTTQQSFFQLNTIQTSPEICCNDTMVNNENCYTLSLQCPQQCAVASWPTYPDSYKAMDCDNCSCQYCYVGQQSGRHQVSLDFLDGHRHLFDLWISPVNKKSKNITVPRKSILNGLQNTVGADTKRLPLPRGGLLESYFVFSPLKGGFKLNVRPRVVLPENGKIEIYYAELTQMGFLNSTVANSLMNSLNSTIESSLMGFLNLNSTVVNSPQMNSLNSTIESSLRMEEPVKPTIGPPQRKVMKVIEYNIKWYSKLNCKIFQFPVIYLNDPMVQIYCKNALQEPIIYDVDKAEFQMVGNILYLKELTTKGRNIVTVSAMYKGRIDSRFNVAIALTMAVPADTSLLAVYECTAVLNFALLNYTQMTIENREVGFKDKLTDRPSVYKTSLPFNKTTRFHLLFDGTKPQYTITTNASEMCCKYTVFEDRICHTINVTCPKTCQISSWPEFADMYRTPDCGNCSCQYCYVGNISTLYELALPLKSSYSHLLGIDVSRVDTMTTSVMRPRRQFLTSFEIPFDLYVELLPPPRNRFLQLFVITQTNWLYYLQPEDNSTLPPSGQFQLYFQQPGNKPKGIIRYDIGWYVPLNCSSTSPPVIYLNGPWLHFDCENARQKTIVYNITNPNFQLKNNYVYLKDLSTSYFEFSLSAMYEGSSEQPTLIYYHSGRNDTPLFTTQGCRAVFDFRTLNYSGLVLHSKQLGFSRSLSGIQLYNINLPPNKNSTIDLTINGESTVNTFTAKTPEFCNESTVFIHSYTFCQTFLSDCAGSAWPNYEDLYKTSECSACNCSYCYIGGTGNFTPPTTLNIFGKPWTVPAVKRSQYVRLMPRRRRSPVQLPFPVAGLLPLPSGSLFESYFYLTNNNTILHRNNQTLPPNGQFHVYFQHAFDPKKEIIVSEYNLMWYSPLRCNVSYLQWITPIDPLLSVDCDDELPIPGQIIYNHTNPSFQMKNNRVYLKNVTATGSFNISITAMYEGLEESATVVNVSIKVDPLRIYRLTAVKDSKYRYTFTCYTNSDLKDLTYEWYWNDIQVVRGLSFSMRNGKSQGKIVFDGFKENDSGNVTCRVKREGYYLATKIKPITMKDFPVVELNTTSYIIKNEKPVTVGCYLFPMSGTPKLFFKVNNITINTSRLALSEKATVSCYGVNDVGQGEIKTLRISVAIAGKKFCPPVKYKNIEWPETTENTTANVPCSKDFSGTVSRFCSINVKWKEPDTSNCVKNSILDAQNTLERTERLGGNFESAVEELANATKGSLEAKDITETVTSLDIVSRITESRKEVSRKEVTGFVDVVSNLVGNNTKSAWTKLEDENQLTPASIMRRTEDFGNMAAKKINKTLDIPTENLVLKFQKVDVNVDIQFSAPIDSKTDWARKEKVFIPSNILKDKFGANESVAMSAVIFRNMQDLLPKSKNTTATVNSYIVSISLGRKLENLSENILLSFSHLDAEIRYVVPEQHHEGKELGKPSCNFWEYGKTPKLSGDWSTRGCTVYSTNSTYTVCSCDHLTSFAILMKPVGVKLSKENKKALGIITQVGCSISIAALVVTMIVYGIFWKYVTSQDVTRSQSILLMNLCVSLIIAYLLFLTAIQETGVKIACIAIAALIHYFLLVSFFTMFAEGVDMAIALTVVFTSRVPRLPWLLVLSWVGPAIIVGISLAVSETKGFGNDEYCWLTFEDNIHWSFIAPVLIIILANIICVVLIVKALLSAYCMVRESVKQRLRTGARAIGILTPLLGFAWLFGVFSVHENLVVFDYIFTVANSLQGLFIFLSYCVFNKQIRKHICKRERPSSQTPAKPSTQSYTQRTKATELSSSKKDSLNDDYLRESSEVKSEKIPGPYYLDPGLRFTDSGLSKSIVPYYITPTPRTAWNRDKV